MGYVRAKWSEEGKACYDMFHALPDLSLDEPWEYGQMAFALTKNQNPNTPMTGIAIYDVECVKATPKSVIVWASGTVFKEGEGVEPKFPKVISLATHDYCKLIKRR